MKIKLIYILFLLANAYNTIAQQANVSLTIYVTKTSHVEEGCSEAGKEEFTGKVWFWTDTDTTWRGGSCRECTNNGNCTNSELTDGYTYSNTNAYVIDGYIDAWEDDMGDRCKYETGLNDDDCHLNKYLSTWTSARNFRENDLPSNGDYYYYGGNMNQFGNDKHWAQLGVSWKYTGTASSITPSCTVQSTTHYSGRVRSNSVYLTAGVTYRFETTSGPDTYLRLYGPDGYTIKASNDDGGEGTLSLIEYTPTTTGTYYIENSEYTRSALTLNSTLAYSIVESTPASSISATSTVFCSGGSTTLSVVGGSLNNGATWKWYSASCGGTYVGTGSSINVSPLSTTTYYVRAEEGCNTTSCVSWTITVDQPPTTPTSITVSSGGNAICPGDSRTLTASGGETGTSCTYQWYSGHCGSGTVLGTGISLNVEPYSTTTYFVRRVGTSTCTNTTGCASSTITLNTESIAPSSINAVINP